MDEYIRLESRITKPGEKSFNGTFIIDRDSYLSEINSERVKELIKNKWFYVYKPRISLTPKDLTISNAIGYVDEWYEDHIVTYINKSYYDMCKNLPMGIMCSGEFIGLTKVFKIKRIFGYQPLLNL